MQRSRQSIWDDPQRVLLYVSLVLALLGGFGLGACMVLAFAGWLPVTPNIPALMQVHGQVQTVGFLVLFILAIAVQLFPRFHNTRLRHPRLIAAGGLLAGAGVTLRAVGQPLDLSGARTVLLALSAPLIPVGLILAVLPLASVVMHRENGPPLGMRALLPVTAVGSLAAATVLNFFLVLRLAGGAAVAPLYMDEAVLHLQLWGFATTLVLAVSGRMYPRLLLLQPTRGRLLDMAVLFWAGGTAGVALILAAAADRCPRFPA
ncbi:MAG: hypothetical protein NTZ05_19970 [Chloroflexi bacterium]|nr:hypothetical protein [Chloroflexota bacterium]